MTYFTRGRIISVIGLSTHTQDHMGSTYRATFNICLNAR